MRILYLSPGFPPNSHLFCVAAQARGASVVAVGDVPESDLPPDARDALDRYVFEPRMGEYDVLLGVVESLVAEHGPIDFVESNGEHWLEVEGRLRDDLGIEGLTARDVARLRSKLAMAEVFEEAGVPSSAGHPLRVAGSRQGLRREARPCRSSSSRTAVRGPCRPSGCRRTPSSRPRSCSPLDGHVVQPFVDGVIVTFDGLVDQAGRVVFCTSHAYDRGIMEVRTGALDGFYYSLRAHPAGARARSAARRSQRSPCAGASSTSNSSRVPTARMSRSR